LKNGKVEQGEVVSLDHFFAGTGSDGLGKKLPGFGKQRKHFEFVKEALRRFEIHKDAYAVGEFVEGVHAKSELHPGFGAELVDEELRAGVAFDVLEKEGGATRLLCGVPPGLAWRDSRGRSHTACGSAGSFADAVGYFCDFQDGVNFRLDAF
jgi:hypothetical protein